MKNQGREALDEHEERAVIAGNLNGFVGWLMVHVNSVGASARRQSFYVTFMCQFYGMSREGIEMLSQYGYCQCLRSYDGDQTEEIHKSKDRTRYSLHHLS
jgi:hypothetical protein